MTLSSKELALLRPGKEPPIEPRPSTFLLVFLLNQVLETLVTQGVFASISSGVLFDVLEHTLQSDLARVHSAKLEHVRILGTFELLALAVGTLSAIYLVESRVSTSSFSTQIKIERHTLT